MDHYKLVKYMPDNFYTLVEGIENALLSNIDVNLIRENISSSGAILFRNFSVSDTDFRNLASSLGGEFIPHGAPSRPSVSADGSLHLANPGKGALNLHIELGYFPLPPDFIWFHCVNPAKEAGGTLICDGMIVAERLSNKFHTFFSDKKIRYSAFWPKDQWSRYFQTQSKEELENFLLSIMNIKFKFSGDRLFLEYFVDAFKSITSRKDKVFANCILHYVLDGFSEFISLDDGSKIPDWVIDEALSVCNLSMKEVYWKKDDLLVLDNTRVMHGRKRHSDPERRLHVRMQRIY